MLHTLCCCQYSCMHSHLSPQNSRCQDVLLMSRLLVGCTRHHISSMNRQHSITTQTTCTTSTAACDGVRQSSMTASCVAVLRGTAYCRTSHCIYRKKGHSVKLVFSGFCCQLQALRTLWCLQCGVWLWQRYCSACRSSTAQWPFLLWVSVVAIPMLLPALGVDTAGMTLTAC